MNKENDKIEWTDNYSVGDDQIDIQHKRILNYINLLSTSPFNSIKKEDFHELLAEVSEYALFHLKYEEKLLQQLNYPDFDKHQKEHENLIEKTALLSFDADNHEIDTPEKLRKFLLKWWEEHILVQDMKFKPFLLSKKNKP